MILFDIYTKEKQKQMFCLLLKVRFPKSSFKKGNCQDLEVHLGKVVPQII